MEPDGNSGRQDGDKFGRAHDLIEARLTQQHRMKFKRTSLINSADTSRRQSDLDPEEVLSVRIDRHETTVGGGRRLDIREQGLE